MKTLPPAGWTSVCLYMATLIPAQAADDAAVSLRREVSEARKLVTVADSEEGRTITLHKIEPPALKAASPDNALPVTSPVETEAVRPTREAGPPEKEYRPLLLSVDQYDGIAEIRWSSDGQSCRAWSNMDFPLFHTVSYFATETMEYSCFFVLSELDEPFASAAMPPSAVAELRSSRSARYYVPDLPDDSAQAAEFLQSMDDLHEFYEREEVALRKAWQSLLQQRADQPPPLPARQNVTIYYWKAQ